MDGVYVAAYMTFSFLVIPFWIMMIAAPNWPKTEKIMRSLWPVVPFMLAYAILELPHVQDIAILLYPNMDKLAPIFASRQIVTLAWLHFLACDLFVGRWVYLDSRKHGFSPLTMAPILFFCLALCPLGFSSYLALRWYKLKGSALNPEA